MKSIGGKSVVGGGASGSTSGSGSGTNTGVPLSSEPQQLIHDLLEALTTLSDDSDAASTTATTPSSAVAPSVAATTTPTEERAGTTGGSARRQLHLSRSSSANDMVVQEADEQVRAFLGDCCGLEFEM